MKYLKARFRHLRSALAARYPTPLIHPRRGGDSPAFAAALSTGQVAVMNYGSGNGRIIQMTESGLHFDQEEVAAIVTFPRLAGVASHPHMAFEHGDEILVPDLVSSLQLA